MAAITTAGSGRRAGIDERIVVAGTTPRFALLVVLFLASAASMASDIANLVVDRTGNKAGCLLAAGVNPDGSWLGETIAGNTSPYAACERRFVPATPGWFIPAVLVSLLVLAGALYWVLPLWRGRRTVAIDNAPEYAELWAELADLVSIAGLSRPPGFVVDPSAATTSAVVFGRRGRYTVCLHGGLIARRLVDNAGFHAVVLHELAHIRNQDVDVTYATVAIWRIFLFVMLIPHVGYVVVAMLFEPFLFRAAELPTGLRSLIFSAGMVILVFLARADVLRTREHYADLDARRWGADPSAVLLPVVPALPAGRLRRVVVSFGELWRSHPTWSRRSRALIDPADLFDTQVLPMFLTGAAASVVVDLATSAVRTSASQTWLTTVLSWLAAALIAGIAGVALWRSVIYAVLTGRRTPTGLSAGLGLGFGSVVGELLLNRSAGGHWLPAQPEVLLVLVAIAVLVTCWTAQIAELWTTVWPGRSIRVPVAVGLVMAWVIYGVWFTWWQATGRFWVIGSIFDTVAIRQALDVDLNGPVSEFNGMLSVFADVSTILFTFTAKGLLLLAGSLLWLPVLLAWTVRPVAGPARWIRQTSPDSADPEVHSATGLLGLPPMRRVLLPSAAFGVLCWVAVIAVRVTLRPAANTVLGGFLYVSWLAVVCAGTAMVAAAATALLANRYRLLVALVSSAIAVLVGLLGVFLLTSVDGCLGPMNLFTDQCAFRPAAAWPLVWVVLPFAFGDSMFIALATALLVLAARRLMRIRGTRSAAVIARGMVMRRIMVTVISAVMVTFAVVVSVPAVGGATRPGGTSLTAAEVEPSVNGYQSASSRVRIAQLYAWSLYGGHDLITRYLADLTSLTNALQPADQWPVLRKNVRPVCAELTRWASAASAYFPVPDLRAQESWATAVSDMAGAGTTCTWSVDKADFDSFTSALGGMTTAAKVILSPLREVQMAVGAACTPATRRLAYCGMW